MTNISAKVICKESLEIQQDAKNLVAEFGSDAVAIALENMQDLIDRDDAKSAQRWLAIAHEIEGMDSHQIN